MVKRRTVKKSKIIKQKQRQSVNQKQNVVINMGNPNRRKRRRNPALLRGTNGSVIKHVHSYGNNIFQANLEREKADINHEMNMLRSERHEINKLKAIEEKKKHQGVFARVSPPNRLQTELETGTTPSKTQYDDLVSNIAPKTPKGSPPPDGRLNMNAKTAVPGYATPTASSMGRTLNVNDL